jgi:heme-degrading monooxygenase HmoA
MDMSQVHWASGNWLVKQGSEEEFVTHWKDWLGWTSQNVSGFRTATLIRSNDDPRRFTSFSDWDDEASRAAWASSDEYRQKFGAVRELCDEFIGGTYEQAASFSSAGASA